MQGQPLLLVAGAYFSLNLLVLFRLCVLCEHFGLCGRGLCGLSQLLSYSLCGLGLCDPPEWLRAVYALQVHLIRQLLSYGLCGLGLCDPLEWLRAFYALQVHLDSRAAIIRPVWPWSS